MASEQLPVSSDIPSEQEDCNNLFPFLALALAAAKHIQTDLDREYQKNPTAYYHAAQKSKYCNNIFSQRFSLQTEDAYRKAI